MLLDAKRVLCAVLNLKGHSVSVLQLETFKLTHWKQVNNGLFPEKYI